MSTAVSLGATSIDSTIGALVVGWGVSMLYVSSPSPNPRLARLINLALGLRPYGMLCIQVYYYFQRYPKDTLALKLLVRDFATYRLISSCR